MNNYEIIKECKIVHEYINDLITNGELEISDSEYKSIKSTLEFMDNTYTNTYEKMKESEKEKLTIKLPCPHCDKDVCISDVIDYAYVCESCDENFYFGEGDLDFAWYYEDFDPMILKEDFDLELSFDSDEKNVIIGTRCSSGAKYNCNTTKDLRQAIESYACNYLDFEEEEYKYSIEIWESEYDREEGYGFIYNKTFDDLKNAIIKARSLFDKYNYACIEVLDDKNTAKFNKDSESETFYINNEKIVKVEREVLSDYVDKWTEHKELPIKEDKLYCEEEGKYVTVDNTSGDCFVEEYTSEKDAFFWLLDIEEEKEMENDF